VVVTRNGRPVGVLVNIKEYERLKATVDVLSDENLMRQIRAGRRHFASGGKGLTMEQVFGPEPKRAGRTRR
jgi:antitoxin YefM